TKMSSVLAGFMLGDGYEMAHHIWWFKYALQTGQPLFYQPLLAYPNGIVGVPLWTDPLQFFPAWLFALVMPLLTASNLTILLTMALNGWAMFFLVRYLIRTQERTAQTAILNAPALLAGLVFMLYPTMQGHLGAGHAGLLVQWPLVIYVYCLLRLREQGGWRWMALVVIFFFLSLTGYTLQLIYATLPVTAIFGLMLIAERNWAALRRAVIAVLLGGVLLGLFLLPVFSATVNTYQNASGIVKYSADLLAVATPSFLHPLFDKLEYTHRILGLNLDEGVAYVGVIAAVLSLIAVWKVRQARWWLGLALLAWVLSLGPLLKILNQTVTYTIDGYSSYVTLPFALFEGLPLINLERTPARFNFALALAVAILAGYGAAYLWRRIRLPAALKWAGLALTLVLIAFEYQVFWPLPTTPAEIPKAIADLGGLRDVRAVFDIPWQNFVTEQNGLYLQTAHELPLIAGHVTRSTPVSPAKLNLLQTLDPALLRAAGADAVIVHRGQDGDGSLEALARQQLGDPVYEDGSLALFMTPKTEATPTFMALLSAETTITTQADSYAYAPEDGWGMVSAALRLADLTGEQRQISLLVDGVVAQRFEVNAEQTIAVPLPMQANQFHTITLALDPACPDHYDAALECRAVAAANMRIDFTPAEASAPVMFEKGVTLANAHLPEMAQASDTLPVWMWWRFDQAVDESAVRFVHVTDAAGKLVAQQDNPLGTIAAGETRAESVEIALPADLPAGEYSVSVGWYSYPAIENFCVLTNGSCGARLVTVGTVRVGS
ncbi:MAG: hypothetical protein ABI700_04735, partial [Chloroflexota bacterium]